MKKIFILIMFLIILLTGCKNSVNDGEATWVTSELIKVESSKQDGFHWDYLLFIPETVPLKNDEKIRLLVEPLNTPSSSDKIRFFEEYAERTALQLPASQISKELAVPLLVPIFMRPETLDRAPLEAWRYYTHRLDRNTMELNISKYRRLDKQLLAMIDHATKILKDNNILIHDKIFLYGYSATAHFTNRFTLIHPDRVKASVSGGISVISLPEEQRDYYSHKFDKDITENLYYPIGTYDFKKITGKGFDFENFKNVAQFLFRGGIDSGDPLYSNNTIDDREREIYSNVFKTEPIQSEKWDTDEGADIIAQRLITAQEFYQENDIEIDVKIYENVGHTTTPEIINDVIDFYKSNN